MIVEANFSRDEVYLSDFIRTGPLTVPSNYRIDRTTPPSTRKAAPLVAEESGLAT